MHLCNLEQIPTCRDRVIRTGHRRHTTWPRLPRAGWETYCNLHSLPQSPPPLPSLFLSLIMWLFALRGQNTLLGSNQLKTAPEVIATVDYTFVIVKEEKHKSKKQSGTKLDFSSLPSLLLVRGMLWTVRSLKQELVRTWSSTELKTQDGRSDRKTTHTEKCFNHFKTQTFFKVQKQSGRKY